jgi:MFS family permease
MNAGSRTRVLVLLLSAGMTYSLSQTLILPAIPALVRSLGASPLAVSWLLTAFLVSASVATPVIGRLGDLLGRGRVLTWTMAAFCAGSVLCALGGTLALLVAGRVLQGVAGGVFPLAYGIVRDTWPAETRMRAIGMVSISLGAGAALGPVVAGVIVDQAAPATIFWVATIGALPALAAARLIPEAPPAVRAAIDWPGAALLAGWLTAALVLVTQGQRLGWSSPPAVGLALVTALLLSAWLRLEDRRRDPLVDLPLLRERTIALTNLAGLCVGCGIFMAYAPLAPMAQAPASLGYGLGLSVAAAGALLVPHGAVQILIGPAAGDLCARIGARATLVIGTALNTVTMAGIAAAHGSVAALLVGGTMLGVGQPMALTAMANLIVATAPQRDVGIATGMNAVMRTMGMALGSALSAAILAGATAPGAAFASEHGYVVAFAVAACATAGAVVCAAALPPHRRRVAVAPTRVDFSSGTG